MSADVHRMPGGSPPPSTPPFLPVTGQLGDKIVTLLFIGCAVLTILFVVLGCLGKIHPVAPVISFVLGASICCIYQIIDCCRRKPPPSTAVPTEKRRDSQSTVSSEA